MPLRKVNGKYATYQDVLFIFSYIKIWILSPEPEESSDFIIKFLKIFKCLKNWWIHHCNRFVYDLDHCNKSYAPLEK